MSSVEFTDDEIREELAHLGYHNVPQEKLEDFKRDLMKLISTERSKSNSLNNSRTTEHEIRDENSELEQHGHLGPESEKNVSNHANQWIGSKFNEDWQYRGEKEIQHRPQTAPEQRGRQRRGKLNVNQSSCEPCPSVSYPGKNQTCFRDDVSETNSEGRMMKRKTSRKTANGCRLVDESFTDSESGVFEIYEKIKNLAMRECECGKTKPKSGDIEPPYRFKGKVNKYPSVIKSSGPPHTRNLVPTNVYERYNMYKHFWKIQPAIGDDERIGLRKAVHAKLLQVDEIKMKQKVYVPNHYVPPHEKHRRAVRWKVRQAIEKYELPEHGFYHEV